MKFKKDVYEPGELGREIKAYLEKAKKTDAGYFCLCGSPIRQGFVPTFPVDREGNVLDTTETPRKVPYCERCDPPDGLSYSYAVRVFIIDKKTVADDLKK